MEAHHHKPELLIRPVKPHFRSIAIDGGGDHGQFSIRS